MNATVGLLFWIIIVLQAYQPCHFRLISIDEECDIDEVLTEIQGNQAFIFQQVTNASNTIKQQCAQASVAIKQATITDTVPKIVEDMTTILLNKFPNSIQCTRKIQDFVYTVQNYINTKYIECTSESKQSQIILQQKSDFMDKWVSSVKLLISVNLEKCMVATPENRCEEFKICCYTTTTQITNKILEMSKNNTDSINEIVTKLVDCFTFVEGATSLAEIVIRKNFLECSVPESNVTLSIEGVPEQNVTLSKEGVTNEPVTEVTEKPKANVTQYCQSEGVPESNVTLSIEGVTENPNDNITKHCQSEVTPMKEN